MCGVIVRLLLQLLLHSHGDTDLIGDVAIICIQEVLIDMRNQRALLTYLI